MVDERGRARIVDAVLKFGVGCVGTLCMVDHPDQEVANIFDVVFFDCHLLIKPGPRLFCGILHEFRFPLLRELAHWLRVKFLVEFFNHARLDAFRATDAKCLKANDAPIDDHALAFPAVDGLFVDSEQERKLKDADRPLRNYDSCVVHFCVALSSKKRRSKKDKLRRSDSIPSANTKALETRAIFNI